MERGGPSRKMVSWGASSGSEWGEEGERRSACGKQRSEWAKRAEGTATLRARGQRFGRGSFKSGRVGALWFAGSGGEELPGQL